MRNRYDMQLHLLDTQLTHMGELCETAIAKVTQALKEGNTEQAKIVIKEDEEIDQIEKDIERLCLKLLLQQQPVARDQIWSESEIRLLISQRSSFHQSGRRWMRILTS